jgi:hypothetical protein
MHYLKHKDGKGKAPSKPKKQPVVAEPVKVVLTGPATDYGTPSMQHDVNHVAGLADVERSLDFIARSIGHLTNDACNVNLSLSTGFNSAPVKIAFDDDDDNMERLVTAFERVADSVAKLAGFNRPRLERWHEQVEYEPRYKDIAVDGGAPGPKAQP